MSVGVVVCFIFVRIDGHNVCQFGVGVCVCALRTQCLSVPYVCVVFVRIEGPNVC